MDTPAAEHSRRRPRSLATEVVTSISDKIRDGRLKVGDKMPTEAAIMGEFAVSRTVVREALSKLQASGFVETRHGIGTFVLGPGTEAGFRITREQYNTLQDVIAVLELRIGIETEAAVLASQRRTDANLQAMRTALDALASALENGQDAVAADFQFHHEIARATQNNHFAEVMTALGSQIIPRARLEPLRAMTAEHQQYLRRVSAEHESIFDAIAGQDSEGARAAMRMHLANSRERRRRAQGPG